MTTRMLALDLRRGPAPVLLVAVGALLALGAGCDAVLSLRQAMGFVFPCVLAAGVWHGGSARRRGVDEAIAAASLPPWRRSAVEGGSLGVAALGATVVLLAVSGGCTSVTFAAAVAALAGVVALVAAAFAGLALGRVASGPMAAPLTLFAVLVVTFVFGGWSGGRAMLLLPDVAEEVTTADLTVRISVAQLLWFAGLAISGWLLAGRARAPALIPAAVGLAALWAVA